MVSSPVLFVISRGYQDVVTIFDEDEETRFPYISSIVKFTVLNTPTIRPSHQPLSRLFHFIIVLISTSFFSVLILQPCMPKHLNPQCQETARFSQPYLSTSPYLTFSASPLTVPFFFPLKPFLLHFNVSTSYSFSLFLSLLHICNRARGTSFPISPFPDIGIT